MSDKDLIRRGDAKTIARIAAHPIGPRENWSEMEVGRARAVDLACVAIDTIPAVHVGIAHPSPDVAALVEALAVLRHAILDALRQSSDMEYCLNLFGLAARTDLPRETLRGIIADMRAEGLVSYHKGLWSEDGTPGGAGYAITDAGRAALARLKGGAA